MYGYDGGDAWHVKNTWTFGRGQRPSVSMNDGVVVVGVSEVTGGTVYIYRQGSIFWPDSLPPPGGISNNPGIYKLFLSQFFQDEAFFCQSFTLSANFSKIFYNLNFNW